MAHNTRSIGPVTQATSGSAAVVLIVVWILRMFGIDVPNEVQGAFTVLIVLGAGYLVLPSKDGKYEAK